MKAMLRKTIKPVLLALGLMVLRADQTAAQAFTKHNCVVQRVQFTVTNPLLGNSSYVGVRCQAPAPNGVVWFDVNYNANPDKAKMVLSLATTAKTSGQTLEIAYDPTDLSGASFGCQNADCRIIQALEMF